jgi:hypothetical protein
MPVRLGDSLTGTTRDVSASGIFFEADCRFAKGSSIRFTIDIEAPAGRMALDCQGEIIRVEERADRVGVAVRILESVLKPASEGLSSNDAARAPGS